MAVDTKCSPNMLKCSRKNTEKCVQVCHSAIFTVNLSVIIEVFH